MLDGRNRLQAECSSYSLKRRGASAERCFHLSASCPGWIAVRAMRTGSDVRLARVARPARIRPAIVCSVKKRKLSRSGGRAGSGPLRASRSALPGVLPFASPVKLVSCPARLWVCLETQRASFPREFHSSFAGGAGKARDGPRIGLGYLARESPAGGSVGACRRCTRSG